MKKNILILVLLFILQTVSAQSTEQPTLSDLADECGYLPAFSEAAIYSDKAPNFFVIEIDQEQNTLLLHDPIQQKDFMLINVQTQMIAYKKPSYKTDLTANSPFNTTYQKRPLLIKTKTENYERSMQSKLNNFKLDHVYTSNKRRVHKYNVLMCAYKILNSSMQN